MKPIADETLSSVPVTSSISSEPPNESGAAARISSAGVNAPNSATRITSTSEAAIPSTVSSSRKAWLCDSSWPPTSSV